MRRIKNCVYDIETTNSMRCIARHDKQPTPLQWMYFK